MNADAKWIVGLDLQPTSEGAVEFAAWLAGATTAEHREQLIGIHVLEQDYLRAVLRHHHLDEIESKAKQAARAEIDTVGATDHFAAVHVLQGQTAEQQIQTAAEYHNARGIIIGRQAPKEGRRVLRLGRVARRVLRGLARPTVVVPPDYDASVNSGPVVATCNLREDCVHGVRFAVEMAKRLGRDAVLVHVVPLPEDYAAHYLPKDSLAEIREENRTQGLAELDSWTKEHGLDGLECVVAQGGVVEQLVTLAADRKACLVATGSRRLSMFERMLLTSVGSELAATAPCPVAVVPPVQQA